MQGSTGKTQNIGHIWPTLLMAEKREVYYAQYIYHQNVLNKNIVPVNLHDPGCYFFDLKTTVRALQLLGQKAPSMHSSGLLKRFEDEYQRSMAEDDQGS